MSWTISFYSEKVELETLGYPAGILANFLRIAEMIEELGPNLGLPYTRAMGDGLFEIRVKGREGIGRSFFCTVEGHEVVILSSFIKKTRQTPRKELDKARKRLREVKS